MGAQIRLIRHATEKIYTLLASFLPLSLFIHFSTFRPPLREKREVNLGNMNDENIVLYYHDNANPDRLETFTVSVFGNQVFTTVTRTPAVVRRWISKILYDHRLRRDRLVVGLGVQWRPPITNPVATLQLCVGCQCLIFQIAHANSIPCALRNFLSNTCTTFVGVRNENDARLLRRDYGLHVDRVIELGSWANLRGASMEKLASEVLGFPGIQKPEWIGRSDWDDWCLTDEQVQYACVDAHVSFEIGKQLMAWNWDPCYL